MLVFGLVIVLGGVVLLVVVAVPVAVVVTPLIEVVKNEITDPEKYGTSLPNGTILLTDLQNPIIILLKDGSPPPH